MINPYSYRADTPDFVTKLTKETRGWQQYAVAFPTAHPTRHEKSNTVRGEYFRPRSTGHKLPLAILVHGLGDRSVIPMKLLARYLAGRGIACFVLYLVLHSSRMPPEQPSRLSSDEWFENYRISVIDVRQVIDWAETRDELDSQKIAVVGISFGGFISAIAMGVDQRLRAGVLIISGGNLEKIAYLSKTLPKRWGFRHTEAEFRAQQESYSSYLNKVAEKGWEMVEPAQRGFLIDALTYAGYLRDRPLLMINARRDEVIPKEATLDFWEASGRPAISWLPGGHITIWLWYPLIQWKIGRFLKATFGL
ncbi:MAG: alpha/beta hydrolase [Dehalococcoidales bacterium]|nr:alpha/beta hydrolase [Dehalococcoidales bacterium]